MDSSSSSSWRAWAIFVVLAGSVGFLACGPSETGDGPLTGDVDASASGEDGGGGPQPDAWVSGPDASCGEQTEPIELINLGDPPDMLIVLDRSGSMADPLNFMPPWEFKWPVMSAALEQLTEATESNIRYGLAVFPTDDNCAVDPGAVVPIDIDQHDEIETWLDASGPGGNTPAHLGLANALDIYNSIAVNDAGRYVLFATDGIPNCVAEGEDAEAMTLAGVNDLAAAGIDTFVLGFGDPLGLDVGLLNDCAMAGGVPRPGGPPHYYYATNSTELQTALEDIAGGIIVPSCSYELASPPPDPEDVTVTIDGVPVPRSQSHTNGWDYYPDANTITFFGTYCDDIMAGSVGEVSFVYGCPGPVVP